MKIGEENWLIKKNGSISQYHDSRVISSFSTDDKEKGDVIVSSTDQEDKKAERSIVLAENVIISSVHASKEDFDVGINATDEQCNSNSEKDGVIHHSPIHQMNSQHSKAMIHQC